MFKLFGNGDCFLSYIDIFNKNVYDSDDVDRLFNVRPTDDFPPFLREGNHHHRSLSFPTLSEASEVSELKTITTAF